MNWTLEVVPVPVADVDRAKAFYSEQVGFAVDHDTPVGEEMRIVQLTPPGSGCSIVIGAGLNAMKPGSLQGLQLVVPDIEAARAEATLGDIPLSYMRISLSERTEVVCVHRPRVRRHAPGIRWNQRG